MNWWIDAALRHSRPVRIGTAHFASVILIGAGATPTHLSAQQPERMSVVIELEIRGRAHGDSALLSVRDVGVGPKGEFVVADQKARNVKVFGTNGALIRVVGRGGSGPGEFGQFLSKVLVAPDGRIVVPEAVARHAQWFTWEGNYIKTTPAPTGLGMPLGFAVMPDGTLIQGVANFGMLGSKRVMDSTIDVRAWTDEQSRPIATVGTGAEPQVPSNLGLAPVWAWNGRTEMVVGSGLDFNLRLYDSQGRLVRKLSRNWIPDSVTNADRDLLINAIVSNSPLEQRNAVAMGLKIAPFADVYPAMVALVVADDGVIWTQRPATAEDLRSGRVKTFDFHEHIGAPSWDVFDRDGSLRMRVDVPLGFHLTRIVQNVLYGYSLDTDGLPVVQRLRLKR